MSEPRQINGREEDSRVQSGGAEARQVLVGIIAQSIDALVAAFYETLLAHEEASEFLSHSVVQDRLSGSLRGWILDLLEEQDEQAFADRQMQIGHVHARIKIPIHLVLEGATVLKSNIGRQLADLPLSGREVACAMILLDQRVDLAMRLMSAAYVSGTKNSVQVDEAYRLFSLGQDISLERETQRAALLEWSQMILFDLFGKGATIPLPTIHASPFGLWLRHRAAMLFQGQPALASIEAAMHQIDAVLLPKIAAARTSQGATLNEPLGRLQAAIDEIKFLLAGLFQATSALEMGRDPLTRTLNRRFLPSILGREVALARTNGTPFSVMMIDVDHFKQINDRWGHSVGDLVLRQVAELILENVRLSDFVFRYGGEEFLVALVETDAIEAQEAAERIRETIMVQKFRLPDGGEMQATASIGVASFQGHPDYAVLVDAADHALYRAKAEGRNRVEAA
ncbi:MAG TPA: GGDEF domain-containing protein [Rhizobiaceae bacterium]